MKLVVLVSSCIMVSNALPLIDYIYKGYEQAPYTVTADYNVVTNVLMKGIVVFLMSHFRVLRQESIQKLGGPAQRAVWQ